MLCEVARLAAILIGSPLNSADCFTSSPLVLSDCFTGSPLT